MSWAIIADSSCNLRSFTPQAPDTSYYVAPLNIRIGSREFVDDQTLDVDELNRLMHDDSEASSSACPSAGEWARLFRLADNIIAITISSNLSGSYEAALMARNVVIDEVMREHEGIIAGKNIFVLDSKAAGGKVEIIVTMLDRFLASGKPDFDEVVDFVCRLERAATVMFSLCSYDNLVKNGRMPKVAGAIAGKLNMRLLGSASREGAIKVVGSAKTERRSIAKMCDHMAQDGYYGGLVAIDHVNNPAYAEKLKEAIEERWAMAEVSIHPCGGLCSYYAQERGLIVGYEWL